MSEFARDIETLRAMLKQAESLLARSDALMRGQYMHLVGRIRSTLAILETAEGAP